MKEEEDSFIGTEIPTPKGGILKLVSWDGARLYSNKKYTCECSVCSQDEDLWPYGSILVTKSQIKRGGLPCGCSSSPQWKSWQWKVRVNREASERGIIVHGFTDDNVNAKTILDLENTTTGNRWETTSVRDFMLGQGGKLDGNIRTGLSRSHSYEKHVEDFNTLGNYPEGTTFTKNLVKTDHKGYHPYWDVKCSICSKDEYTKAGVCKGIFSNKADNIKKGKVSCRCSDKHKWTKEEREYLIRELCSKEGHTFTEWVGEYTNSSSSKFRWVCSEGHSMESYAQIFVKGGRCTTCQGGGGFNKELRGSLYLARWFCSEYTLIKFGITNKEDVSKRLKAANKESPNLVYETLYTYHHENGGLIADIESEIKRDFKEYLTVPKDLLPDGYTESFFYNEEVLERIRTHVESSLQRG